MAEQMTFVISRKGEEWEWEMSLNRTDQRWLR